ncbi:MAG: hypothetical protein U1D97_10165 [Desulfuromonadales bacterium]|nr:hypothetical protein [Desulfuromonadales bacterium]
MKKISHFSKGERAIAVISAIWLVIWFVVAMNESNGFFDEEFVSFFFIFGLLPVLVVVGWKWIQGAATPKN